jgi:hypothetical protein
MGIAMGDDGALEIEGRKLTDRILEGFAIADAKAQKATHAGILFYAGHHSQEKPRPPAGCWR